MRKLALLVAIVFAFSFSALAQGTSTGTSQSQTSTDTGMQAPQKGKKSGAASETGTAGSTKESQLTGCLAKDPSGSGYVLTNGKYKKGVAVKSSEDLSAHVGHQVKLNGSWEKPTAGGEGGASAKGQSMKTFDATKVTHISDTCPTGGGKAGKTATKESKTTTSETTPTK
jgi:hypothetical protein